MKKEKIKLEKEKETLLIPLYCKALESKKETPIISDNKAIEIVDKIEYDYTQLKIPRQTHVTICMRAKRFDNYAREFLQKYPKGIVVQLGCGLDSRFSRVDNSTVEWYDLDYPEVIKLRKNFYQETARYHLIPSPVMEFQWIDNLLSKKGPFIFLAEGLFMYLKEEEVKSLILTLQKKFSGSTLIFDSYSVLTAKNVKHHPSLKKTGAIIHWGIDNAHDIEKWNPGIHLIEEWYFTKSEEIRKLDIVYRIIFKIAGLFPVARKAHRILIFQLNEDDGVGFTTSQNDNKIKKMKMCEEKVV